MSSANPLVKTKVKKLKESVSAKDWEATEKNAQDVLSYEAGNYNARVFLALALFNLDKVDDAEKEYKQAIYANPDQPLARQGLATLYEKKQRWSDYAQQLRELMDVFLDKGDTQKYAEALQKLLDVTRKHGSKEELIDVLHILLPSSKAYGLLQQLEPYDATAPDTPYAHVAQALASSLPILIELADLIHSLESGSVDIEVKKRRQRLGGISTSEADTRKAVESEILPRSRLPLIWRAILDHPDAAPKDELRRDTERALFDHLFRLLKALPSQYDRKVDLSGPQATEEKAKANQQLKDRVRNDLKALANDLVLLRIPLAQAWSVVLEGSDDFFRQGEEQWTRVDSYRAALPDEAFGQTMKALQRYFEWHAPRSDDEDEPKAPLEDVLQAADDLLAASLPDSGSVVLHIAACSYYLHECFDVDISDQERPWNLLAETAENGLSCVQEWERVLGKALPRSRLRLQFFQALAMAHVESASLSTRTKAKRLVRELLSTDESSEVLDDDDLTELWFADAKLKQESSNWTDATESWERVISRSPTLSKDQTWTVDRSLNRLLTAHTEAAWARSHVLDSLDDRLHVQREAIGWLEKRHETREAERVDAEKHRSQAGVERTSNEGERPAERLERGRAYWRLGTTLWQDGQAQDERREEAFDAFSTSLFAAPSFAPSFTSLGLYFRSSSPPDLEQASKCFQKAFELSIEEEVAARYLAEEYAEAGNWSLVEVVARRVVQSSSTIGMRQQQSNDRSKAWAWKAIGGSDFASGKYTTAITAFQAALRGDDSDTSTWLRLGSAYRLSGKYVAALKTFSHVLELDSTLWQARYAIGETQREVGLWQAAIDSLEAVLVEHPNEMGVRAILAETSLSKGQEDLRSGLLSRAEEALLLALRTTLTLIKAETAVRTAWKVAADACASLGHIAAPLHEGEIQATIDEVVRHAAKHDVDSKTKDLNAITHDRYTNLGSSAGHTERCMLAAALLYKLRVLLEADKDDTVGLAWYDLARATHHLRKPNESSDSPLATQALRCIKTALRYEPTNAACWNAMGVMTAGTSPRLAQHSFIKAIEYDSRNAVAWANLGFFYIDQGDDELANEAFLKAQVIDPDLSLGWLGQSYLAGQAGHSAEQLSLLKYAFTLTERDSEVDIAYATRAWQEQIVSRESDLTGPLFASTRFIAAHPDDADGLHLSGLVLERAGDLDGASEAMERAADLLEQEYERSESAQVERRYAIAQTNLGRIRLRVDSEGALDAFDAGLSLLALDTEANEETRTLWTDCQIGIAVAKHKLGQTDEALEGLATAIEEAESIDSGCVARLHVAFGKLSWVQGDEQQAFDSFVGASELGLATDVEIAAVATLSENEETRQAARLRARQSTARSATLHKLEALEALERQSFDQAVEAASKEEHSRPWDPTAQALLLDLLSSSRDSEHLALLERLLPDPAALASADERARAYRRLALTRLAKGEESEGSTALQKAAWAAPWADQGGARAHAVQLSKQE